MKLYLALFTYMIFSPAFGDLSHTNSAPTVGRYSGRAVGHELEPVVEYVERKNGFVTKKWPNSTMTKPELLKTANIVLRNFLNASTFKDLVITDSKEVISNARNDYGYITYRFKLKDADGNLFTAGLDMYFKVSPIINPRTGNAEYSLFAGPDGQPYTSDGYTSVRLHNVKGHLILASAP